MQNNLLVHKHLIIRAEALRPPMDEEQLKEWFQEFVDQCVDANSKTVIGITF